MKHTSEKGTTRSSLDLPEIWEIAFDPLNEGVQGGWCGEHWPANRSQPVHVPGIWNIDYPDAEGIGFYRTHFIIPESWRGRSIRIHFEGAIYRCEAWIDGIFVGSHEGGYTPFWFDISNPIHFGVEHNLVVRVMALSKSGPVDGMLLEQTPLSKQSWHYVYGGLWGRVSLMAVPHVSCQSVNIDPDLRSERAKVEVNVQNALDESRQVNLYLRVIDPYGGLAREQRSRISVPPGVSCFSYILPLPRPVPWSFDHPDLYRLEVQLADEEGNGDFYTTHFGMRDFTSQDGQFFLNGESVFIRGVLLQPNYPVTLIAHPNREMMVREITLAKEAGFNLIRVHIQPAPPGFLDLADQLGMMVYAETCLAWIRDSPRMLDHGRREVKAMIERDRNHPSVVFWGIYNENPPASAINSRELVRLAHALDPTRVIVDNSGGSLAIDQDFGWIDRATVTSGVDARPERNLDIHLYLGSPVSESIYDWLRALGRSAQSRLLVDEGFGSLAVMDEFDRECRTYDGKIFVSELGYGGMSDLEETVAGFGGRENLLDARELKILRDGLLQGFQQRHLEQVFGSPQDLFLEAQKLQALGNTQQLEAILSNPRVSGYVLTQLNDVAWEFHAGLLDLWRKPKLAYYAAQRVNRSCLIVVRPRRAVAFIDEVVELDLSLVNRNSLSSSIGMVTLEVVSSLGEVVDRKKIKARLDSVVNTLESSSFTLKIPGEYRILARMEVNGEALAVSEETVLAMEPVNWSDLAYKFASFGKESPFSVLHGSTQKEAKTGSAAGPGPGLYLAAYPSTLTEKEWESLLALVSSGGVALCGALRPEDQLAVQMFNRHDLPVKLHPGIGSWMGCYHWIPDTDLFAGLPAGGLAMRPYAETIPKYVLSEMGGEVQAGSLRNTQSRLEVPSMLWYSDIETLRFGKGAIVFCQYRVFENIDIDPIALRLAANLLRYAINLFNNGDEVISL